MSTEQNTSPQLSIAITGHRPKKLWGYDLNNAKWQTLKNRLKEIILNERKNNPDTTINLISGIALGVDTLFAQLALELREQELKQYGNNSHIHLTVAIPFVGQECKWPTTSQNEYKRICENADKQHIVCSGGYASWKLNKRNEWMVNNCDKLISVWDGSPSGTAHCINYAKSQNKPIIQIDPKSI